MEKLRIVRYVFLVLMILSALIFIWGMSIPYPDFIPYDKMIGGDGDGDALFSFPILAILVSVTVVVFTFMREKKMASESKLTKV